MVWVRFTHQHLYIILITYITYSYITNHVYIYNGKVSILYLPMYLSFLIPFIYSWRVKPSGIICLKNLLYHFWSIDLKETNNFRCFFFLTWKWFYLTFNLKDIFARHRMFGWRYVVFFVTLKMFHSLFWLPRSLPSTSLAPSMSCHFSLAALKIFFLFYERPSRHDSFSKHPASSSLNLLNLWIHVFHQIWEFYSHYLFQKFFCLILFFLCNGNTN